jgi:glycosyltransferase involved in cell wall biosynthesis
MPAGERGTGYGRPAYDLARELRARGHALAFLAIEERGPGLSEYGGFPVYLPWPGAPYGENVVKAVAQHFAADVVLSLFDPWVLGPEGYSVSGRPWLAWFPVDQDPPQAGLIERVTWATSAATFSDYGRRVFAAAAPAMRPLEVIPYGVDLATFEPPPLGRRAELRAAMGIDPGAFLVGQVGANVGHDRKALAHMLRGFAKWYEREGGEADGHLVMWTQAAGAVNIPALARTLGVGERVHVVSPFETGYLGSARTLARFYQALDVLLETSAAEGFGIPMLEAMACGVPVIAAANTSGPELVSERRGWLVAEAEHRAEFTHLGGWWLRPTPEGVAEALGRAYADLASAGRLAVEFNTRGFAKGYDWALIGERWHEQIEALW